MPVVPILIAAGAAAAATGGVAALEHNYGTGRHRAPGRAQFVADDDQRCDSDADVDAHVYREPEWLVPPEH